MNGSVRPLEIQVGNARTAERACTYIRTQAEAGRPIVVRIDKPEKLRSLRANARYWLLIGLIAANVKGRGRRQYHERVWHEYFREKFLTPEEMELPNGRTILRYPSTAKLPHDKFLDYMNEVEVWAAERGVILPDYQP